MNTLKNIIKHFLFKSNLYRISFFSNRYYVLMYHMISDSKNGFFPEISITEFKKQINYLKKNYYILPIESIIEKVKKRENLRKNVVITFDDGYRDNYYNAYPILKKFNVPATIFLSTAYIDKQIPPWFIEVRFMFMKTEEKQFEFSNNSAEKKSFFIMRNESEKFRASDAILSYMMKLTNKQRCILIDKLYEDLNVNDRHEILNLMLNWDYVIDMANNGINFGAHTENHPVMSNLSLECINKEILRSKERIEKYIKKTVYTFAYPFGKKQHYDSRVISILQKLNFSCALTTENGSNNFNTNLYELNRSSPWELFVI